jgi:Protein of unknown function (DUF2283)
MVEYDEEVDILTLTLKKRGSWRYAHGEERGEKGQVIVHRGTKGELLEREVLNASHVIPKMIIHELLAKQELSKSQAEEALRLLDSPGKKKEEQQTAGVRETLQRIEG